jgi:hypothetical protein
MSILSMINNGYWGRYDFFYWVSLKQFNKIGKISGRRARLCIVDYIKFNELTDCNHYNFYGSI